MSDPKPMVDVATVQAGEQDAIDHLTVNGPWLVNETPPPQPVARLLKLPAAFDKASTLEVIDQLRAAVERGEVAGFWGVTIGNDDSAHAWCGSTTHVTRLRGMGAIAHLQACMHSGDI